MIPTVMFPTNFWLDWTSFHFSLRARFYYMNNVKQFVLFTSWLPAQTIETECSESVGAWHGREQFDFLEAFNSIVDEIL